MINLNLACLPTCTLAALKVVQKHVCASTDLDCLDGVVAKPTRDGVCHDAEALSKLVHEAKYKIIVPNSGACKEEPWRSGAFVEFVEERGTCHATFPSIIPLE